MAAWLSIPISIGSDDPCPSSSRKRDKKRASLAASEAAMISASQDDKATLTCFLEPQEITAWE